MNCVHCGEEMEHKHPNESALGDDQYRYTYRSQRPPIHEREYTPRAFLTHKEFPLSPNDRGVSTIQRKLRDEKIRAKAYDVDQPRRDRLVSSSDPQRVGTGWTSPSIVPENNPNNPVSHAMPPLFESYDETCTPSHPADGLVVDRQVAFKYITDTHEMLDILHRSASITGGILNATIVGHLVGSLNRSLQTFANELGIASTVGGPSKVVTPRSQTPGTTSNQYHVSSDRRRRVGVELQESEDGGRPETNIAKQGQRLKVTPRRGGVRVSEVSGRHNSSSSPDDDNDKGAFGLSDTGGVGTFAYAQNEEDDNAGRFRQQTPASGGRVPSGSEQEGVSVFEDRGRAPVNDGGRHGNRREDILSDIRKRVQELGAAVEQCNREIKENCEGIKSCDKGVNERIDKIMTTLGHLSKTVTKIEVDYATTARLEEVKAAITELNLTIIGMLGKLVNGD